MFAYCGNNPVARCDYSGQSWEGIKSFIRYSLHIANYMAVCFGIDTAGLGAVVLDMYESPQGVYHAKTDCWQQHFGYNHLYDAVFDIGTSMKTDQFEFTYDGISYVLWVWKGDYINLGAGAEMGFYYGGGPHWLVDTGLATPMSMSLEYNGETIISHNQTTWWITGFNSNYLGVQASSLTAVFTITFGSSAMYNSFSQVWNGRSGWTCVPGSNCATLKF